MTDRVTVMAFSFTGIAGSFVANSTYAEPYAIANGHLLSPQGFDDWNSRPPGRIAGIEQGTGGPMPH